MIIAKSKLGQKATWIDAVAIYKGVLGKEPPIKKMEISQHHYLRIIDGC